MKVTIYIPVYSPSFAYLDLTVDSAIRQSNHFVGSVVIVYGGGEVSISDVRERYSRQISSGRVVLKDNSKHPGIGNNWNYAIIDCKTDFFCILHQDDMLSKDYVEKMYSCIKDNEGCAACYCPHQNIDSSGRMFFKLSDFIKLLLNKKKELSFKTARPLLRFPIISCPTVFYHAASVRDVGLFSTELHNELDWDYFIRIIAAGYIIKYNNEQLYFYRRHNLNASKMNELNLLKYKEIRIVLKDSFENNFNLFKINGISKGNVLSPLFFMLVNDLIKDFFSAQFNVGKLKMLLNKSTYRI